MPEIKATKKTPSKAGTRKYVRVKDRRQGLKVTDRPLKEVSVGNQWTMTPRQIRFIELWLTPGSPHFGNAYQSAKNAGYSDAMAGKITSNQLGLEWVAEAKKRLINLNPNHTVKALEHMALHAKQDRDRIKALELVGKIQGLFIDRSISHVDVQFTNAVPRPLTEISRPLTDSTRPLTQIDDLE